MNKPLLVTTGVLTALVIGACSPAPKQENFTTESAGEQGIQDSVAPQLGSGLELSAIDETVRPQDDFFRYVNGKWLKDTEIPADKSRYGMFNVVYDATQENLKALIMQAAEANAAMGSNTQKLGDMYNSYMNQALVNQLGLAPLQAELEAISKVQSQADLAAQMGKLFELGVDAPFGFFVYPDLKNPTTNALYLYQSGLTLPDRDYYSKTEDKFVNFRAAAEHYMADILSATGHQDAKNAAQALMKLESLIAEKHISRVEARDAEKNYNKHSLTELQELLNGFAWPAYAQASGFAQVEEIVVRQFPYFEALGEIFASTSLQTWKDYMTFKLIDTYAPRLNQELVDLHFAFHSTTLNGIPEQRPRWKRSVAATSAVLGEVLGQQYVERHFTPAAKAKMDELVQNLITAYGQSIDELTWMTQETKEAALEKLSKFTPKIGYPDKWRDYSALQIKPDELVGNYKRYNVFEQAYYVDQIGQPVDKSLWGMTPQTINAYYSPGNNEIVFPAGILQPPFFNMDADDAVNYGAIGAVIGHEIGHGFDDQGSKYDGDGNLRSWWSEQDRQAFDALGAALVAQFDQFEPIEGQNVNGKLTLGENIGDLAGVTIGYKAYLMSLQGQPSETIEGLTGEQRFFMGYAQVWRTKYREDALRARLLSDPHSPPEFRVNGIVPNVDAFYQAFEVKEGDAMYLKPEDRVRIW